jgi:hypothetical protein
MDQNSAASDGRRFRDYLVTKKSPATVNVALAVIQTAIEDAFNDGLVDANEAARVKKLDERSRATDNAGHSHCPSFRKFSMPPIPNGRG